MNEQPFKVGDIVIERFSPTGQSLRGHIAVRLPGTMGDALCFVVGEQAGVVAGESTGGSIHPGAIVYHSRWVLESDLRLVEEDE